MPFRGSVLVLTGVSTLYLLVSLAIGLSISSLTKSQFVASMATMVITFLPALFLSGFLFDLRSMPTGDPRHQLRAAGAVLCRPLLQTLFLAGNIWGVRAAQRRGAGGHGNRAARATTRAGTNKRLV